MQRRGWPGKRLMKIMTMMATGFFPAILVVVALLQQVLDCSAENIHLRLNEKKDPVYNTVVMTKDIYLSKLEKIATDGLKRLYVSGDFEVKNEIENLVWGNNQKRVQDLVAIVQKIFPEKAVVIVVFPPITQLCYGIKFLKEFENQIQTTHKNIAIGREMINLYVSLTKNDRLQNIIETLEKEKTEEEQNSVVAKPLGDDFEFSYVKGKDWKTGDVYKVLIHEADLVVIQIISNCENNRELTVGGQGYKALAMTLLKLVPADGETHVHQRVRVKLPEGCWENNVHNRNKFTEELINEMKTQSKREYIFGKEPYAIFHIASSEFKRDTKDKISYSKNHEKHIKHIIQMINETLDKKHIVEMNAIKELSVEINCHGNFMRDQNTVCNLTEEQLSDKLNDYLIPISDKSVESIQVKFYACNVGTQKGQKYIHKVLKNVDQNLKNKIKEIIMFKSWEGMNMYKERVSVPIYDKFRTTKLIDEPETETNRRIIDSYFQSILDFWQIDKYYSLSEFGTFGRFTVRMKRNTKEGYDSFQVLPKTEFELHQKKTGS